MRRIRIYKKKKRKINIERLHLEELRVTQSLILEMSHEQRILTQNIMKNNNYIIVAAVFLCLQSVLFIRLILLTPFLLMYTLIMTIL